MLSRKIAAFAVALLLFLQTALPASAYPISFRNTPDSLSLVCSGNLLTINPGNSLAEKSLLVRLTDSTQKIMAEETALPGNSLLFQTDAFPDGTYYVEIYTAAGNNNSYESYASGNNTLQISVTDGKPENVLPEFFISNLSRYAANREDSFALSFYQEKSGIQSLKQAAGRITEKCTSDAEKIKAVHDWVMNNICYDLDSDEGHSFSAPEDVYRYGKAQAEGFARLTAALLRESDVSAKVVSGYAQTADHPLSEDKKDGHFWNEAYDRHQKRWIILDTCWDGASFCENGKKIYSFGGFRYLDPSMEAFSVDHILVHNEDTEGLQKAFSALAQKAEIRYGRTVLYTGDYNHFTSVKVTLPPELQDAKVTFGSSRRSVAPISRKGTIAGKDYGTSYITVRISNGTDRYDARQLVKVYRPFLKFSRYAKTLKPGQSYRYTVKRYGVTGTPKWSVSDRSVAAVDSSGRLTAKKSGTVTLTASLGSVKRSMKVTVRR